MTHTDLEWRYPLKVTRIYLSIYVFVKLSQLKCLQRLNMSVLPALFLIIHGVTPAHLTQQVRDKMAAICHTTHLNPFSSIKMFELRIKLHQVCY